MFSRVLTQILVPACVMAVLVGCSSARVSQTNSRDEFPVVIYVSNQMGKVNPVNIKVSIDQKTIVNGDFSNDGGYSWTPFKTSMKDGGHQIVVTSDNGDAGLDVIFEVDKPLWLVISYWGKNHFQLNISPRPVAFG